MVVNSPNTSVKSEFLIAKIVSNPSETSWSQAYNAGNLFAVLSLQKTQLIEDENFSEPESLNSIGKNVLNNLEQNFFTLEGKNLDSIKQAIIDSASFIPKDIESSFVVAAFIKNILYVFTNDKGKVFIKRGNKFGIILESKEIDEKAIVSASGFVESQDYVVLGTKGFFEIIEPQSLASSCVEKSPEEIAEMLTPQLHEKEENRAAAVIIKYEEIEEPYAALLEEPSLQKETDAPLPPEISKNQQFIAKITTFIKQKAKIPNFKINHTKKMFLTIAIAIIIVLISTTLLAIKKQNETKTKALFDEIYAQAQKSYDEGISLSELNKNLARDNFLAAQKTLTDGQANFSKNSAEEKQISELLQKVNDNLDLTSPEKIAANLNRTQIAVSVENGSGLAGVAGKAADFLEEKGYKILSTTNADNYKYVGITIRVKNSTKAYSKLLEKDLSEKYEISDIYSNLSEDSAPDVIIIIGK